MPNSPSYGDTRQMTDDHLKEAIARARQQLKAPDGVGREAMRNLDIATADFQALDSEIAIRFHDMAGDEQPCEYCDGTGYRRESATWELCLECGGLGRVESTNPIYVATMRGES